MLEAGLRAGDNPRTVALDIVGRVDTTGKRTGGIIGLHSSQAASVTRAKEELADLDRASAYFQRKLRDKTFDRVVLKAIREDKPLTKAQITAITDRYAARLLKHRGDTIARTETIAALGAARHEAFRQALERSNYSPNDVVRTWSSSADARVRHSHTLMNGQVVRGMDTPFLAPSGAALRWPGDSGLGAGPEETINCRCIELIEIDVFGSGAAVR